MVTVRESCIRQVSDRLPLCVCYFFHGRQKVESGDWFASIVVVVFTIVLGVMWYTAPRREWRSKH